MIDPVRITNFNRTVEELEELLLFCIAVAGKNATRTSLMLENLLEYAKEFDNSSPFNAIKALAKRTNLPQTMKGFGFGCFNVKAKGFIQAANSGINLKICSVNELEKIHGIGMKTSRFFILHTRKDSKVACLDTHILKWLSYYANFDVPKQTPTKKKYIAIEQKFLKICEAMDVSPSSLDLKIWNKQRGSDYIINHGNV